MRTKLLVLPIALFLALVLASPAPPQGAGGQGAQGGGSGKTGKPAGQAKEKKPAKKKAKEEEFEPNAEEYAKLLEQFEAEKGKEPYERVLAIERFGEVITSKTVPFLVGLLESEKGAPGIIGAVVRGLGKVGSKEAVEAIVKLGIPQLIGDINISAAGTALANPLEAEAEDWLIKNGLSEAVRKDPESYKLMVQAVAALKSEKRVGVLQNELKKASLPEVKAVVLRSLRDTKPRDAAKMVHPFIRDPDVQVQVAALQVLEAVKSKAYARELIALVKSPHWQVRALCVDLLAMAAHAESVRLFTPLLEDPEPRVRIGAIQGLVAVGGDAVMEPLIRALDKNEGRVLDDLADALQRLTGKSFGPNSTQWESWWGTNKGQVEIGRRPAEEMQKLREAQEDQRTAVYFGLRVVSKNIAFIFDCSGSMLEGYTPLAERKDEPPPEVKPDGKTAAVPPKGKGKAGVKAEKKKLTPKIEVAKGELMKVLEKLPTGVQVNIIRFNSLVEAWKPALTNLDPTTRPEASKFVLSSRPEGLTNLYLALEEAFKDEKLDTIYLLSDGAPTLGEFVETDQLLEAMAKMNQLRKVKIHTIGFHMKPEEMRLMEALAEQNYGVFIYRGGGAAGRDRSRTSRWTVRAVEDLWVLHLPDGFRSMEEPLILIAAISAMAAAAAFLTVLAAFRRRSLDEGIRDEHLRRRSLLVERRLSLLRARRERLAGLAGRLPAGPLAAPDGPADIALSPPPAPSVLSQEVKQDPARAAAVVRRILHS